MFEVIFPLVASVLLFLLKMSFKHGKSCVYLFLMFYSWNVLAMLKVG